MALVDDDDVSCIGIRASPENGWKTAGGLASESAVYGYRAIFAASGSRFGLQLLICPANDVTGKRRRFSIAGVSDDPRCRCFAAPASMQMDTC